MDIFTECYQSIPYAPDSNVRPERLPFIWDMFRMDHAFALKSTRRTYKSPQQGDLRLSGPPSGQGTGSGARTRDRRVPADLRADSQATVLPMPPKGEVKLGK
ncbi:hypothetical protein PoB_002294100 [Plakobranchus ocellatus]|uniref:Uncharacterized protein n=1 Tax=Plakobranchus ocellatus TaxID=259542 RepID=A0AAV3ZKH0_9GAST|nr:hypothetical protein PoB_002294100 [Plakobranchus ocellatus]